jgi:hypothetical protein
MESLLLFRRALPSPTMCRFIPALSVPFFKQAIEIDPQFAMAYASLGLMYGSTGESALATENIRKAYELRDRASDSERFFITAYHAGGQQETRKKHRRPARHGRRHILAVLFLI